MQKSAWDHCLDLSGDSNGCSSLIATLHTSLHTIVHSPETTNETQDDQDDRDFGIALPQYSPLEMHHNAHVNATAVSAPHWISGQCLLCHHGIQGGSRSTDSYCDFLFEVRFAYNPLTITYLVPPDLFPCTAVLAQYQLAHRNRVDGAETRGRQLHFVAPSPILCSRLSPHSCRFFRGKFPL